MAEGGDKGEFNELVKKSLLAAAAHWLKHFLPLHFLTTAIDRYGYKPRRKKWNDYKRAAKTIYVKPESNPKHPMAGLRVANPNYHKEPDPLVWTGHLKAFVTQKPIEMYTNNARFTYLGKNPTIKVLVPLSHPINAVNAGEITKMTAEEKDILRGVANAELARLVDESGFITYSEQIA